MSVPDDGDKIILAVVVDIVIPGLRADAQEIVVDNDADVLPLVNDPVPPVTVPVVWIVPLPEILLGGIVQFLQDQSAFAARILLDPRGYRLIPV